ncbi:hypothetical protein AAG906_016322 [Vitis piasezkii]
MDSNRSINPSGYWTNEKHVQFLNSMEASFVRAMIESNGHPLPRLDRYLPDTSDSTLDLKTHPTRRFSTPVGSRARSDRGADKKASRPLSSQPYNSSQDQVVPQLESRAGDKA